ncbi:MAG: type II secretion system minor pseudopilin GspI [Parvularculaceae bacterium]
MRSNRASQHGFTLIETLVALAVMGFIVTALLTLIAQNTRFALSMRDKEAASIAADNLMVEAMVLRAALETGDSGGDVEVGGRTFSWTRSIIETGVENVLRIDISVFDPQTEQMLAHTVSMRRVK